MKKIKLTKITPPAIRGTVPEYYHGPLYYRETFDFTPHRTLYDNLIFDRKINTKLAYVDPVMTARREDKVLCSADGDLLPEWRTPIKARFNTRAAKKFPEFDGGRITFVSERVRDVIEDIAPNEHYFIPFDVDSPDGSILRLYAFYCGLIRFGHIFALAESQNPYNIPGLQHKRKYAPSAVESDSFIYLNAIYTAGAHLIHTEIGLVYSEELVQRLGDVLPYSHAFTPMGVV